MNRSIRTSGYRCIVTAGLVSGLAVSTAAQGIVRGTVRGMDGTGIPGAAVTAEHSSSITTLTVTTDDSGRFSIVHLNRGEWRFVVEAAGFEAVQGLANIASAEVTLQFKMETDPFNVPPKTGVLAGVTSRGVLESLEVAEELFDLGEYDAAIDAYRSILERAPALTSLDLQIGHAFREKSEPEQALAAYRRVLDADPSNLAARAAIDVVSQTAR